jgi:hypothetical protein
MKVIVKAKRDPKTQKRNPGPLTQALHKRYIALWNRAIRVFLREIIEQDLIQVDTGMSKASLIPLARAVRMVAELQAGISPVRGPRKGYTDITGVYHPKQFKSVPHGIKLGQRAYKVSYGTPRRPVFRFHFEILVYQYLLHELGVVIGTGPWNTLPIGSEAMMDYVQQNAMDVMPDIPKYLVDGVIVDG